MGRKRSRAVGRKETGTFFMVPRAVLESRAYRGVSAKAAKLLLDLGAQYNGYNNGDQCAAWRLMEPMGWRSRDTLGKAKRELLRAGLIERTKQGGLHASTLYAFTWRPIDECSGKLDVSPTRVASALWRKPVAIDATGATPSTPAVSDRHAGRVNRPSEAA